MCDFLFPLWKKQKCEKKLRTFAEGGTNQNQSCTKIFQAKKSEKFIVKKFVKLKSPEKFMCFGNIGKTWKFIEDSNRHGS